MRIRQGDLWILGATLATGFTMQGVKVWSWWAYDFRGLALWDCGTWALGHVRSFPSLFTGFIRASAGLGG